jgi:hypothetical protein
MLVYHEIIPVYMNTNILAQKVLENTGNSCTKSTGKYWKFMINFWWPPCFRYGKRG